MQKKLKSINDEVNRVNDPEVLIEKSVQIEDILSAAREERDTLLSVQAYSSKALIYQKLIKKDLVYLDSAVHYYYDALTLIENVNNDKQFENQKVIIYINLGNLFYRDNPNKSLVYFDKAKKISDVLSDSNIYQFITAKIAFLSNKTEKYEKSLSNYLELIEINENSKASNDKLISLYNQVGAIYYELGRYNNSLKYYLKEYELREKTKNNPLNYEFLDQIGKVYLAMERFDKAEEYYKGAIREYKKQKGLSENDFDTEIARFYNKLGKLYYMKDNFEVSKDYYNKALRITDKFDNEQSKKGKTIILNNLALLYKAQGEFRKALKTIKESDKIRQDIGLENFEFFTLTSTAEIYSQLNDLNNAEKYLKLALKISKENNQTKNEKNAYFLLYNLYEEHSKPDLALKNYKIYKSMSDSLINQEMTDRLAEFQTIYEMEKKEQENEALRRANILEKEKLKLQERNNQYLILAAVLVSIILLILIILYNNRRRANNLLADRNKKIEKQNIRLGELNEELRLNEVHLMEANATKDKFFSIIAHDLRNPMHAINFSSDMIINYYDQLNEDQKKEHVKGIYKTSEQAYNLLENLLQWARAQNKTIEYNPQDTYVYNIAQHVTDLVSTAAENKNISIENNINSDATVYADINMLETVFRNILSNSIKFSNEYGLIALDASQNENFVTISITDNGVGINPENLKKLFKIDAQITTVGTNKEKGTGLGLMLCKEFINVNKGDIWVESTVGEGTTTFFTLPKSNSVVKTRKKEIRSEN